MKKKVTSLLLVIVMMLSMVVTAVPAYAADANDTLVITSDKTEAYPGDVITYTVAIGPTANLAGIQFRLDAPEGLTFKSGALVDGLQTKLGAAMCGFNASNQMVAIVGGMDYTSDVNTDILVVTYTVNAGFKGEVTLGFDAENTVFINLSSEEIPVTVVNTESKVTVTEKPVDATGVSLNKASLSLASGKTEKLVATLSPAGSVGTLEWTSSDNNVATVSADGTVTAVAKGTAVITVKTGNASASCNVTVSCSHASTTTNPAVASTCLVQGNTSYTVCNSCGEILVGSNEKLPLDSNNHLNTKKVSAVTGTCIEPGHAEYVICNDCNTVVSGSNAAVAGPHGAYIDKVDDKYLVSAADCKNPAVYSKSCELCGVASATAIFISGTPAAHTYSDTWSIDNDNHWHECSACGDKKDVENHKFASGFCTVCGLADKHNHNLNLVPAVGATCTENGSKAYYVCSVCNEWYEDAAGTVRIENKDSVKTDALGHKWTEATCTTAKTCTVCNVTEGTALGHTWKAATCTEAMICTVCNVTEGTALGHIWKNANCTEAKICTVCNVTEGTALGHTWKAATCTEAKKCTVCGVTEGTALGHTEAIREENRIEASCKVDGSYDLVTYCSVCETVLKTETKIIVATGEHVYATETQRVASTCKTAGYVVMACGCGQTKTTALEINADNHENLVVVNAVAPTCTETGLTEGCYCSACDVVIAKQIVIDALGHIFVNYVPNKDATCTTDGTKTAKCERCDATDTVAVEGSASHKWTEATCTTAKTCTVCNATEGEALGHKWAEATCTVAKTCTVCNATEGEALGHTWADATCTTAKTCTVCNVTEGEALGHKWTEATCTTAKTCTVCNATEGEALGHTWADATCTAAKTCTVCNVTEGEALGHTWADATCTAAKTCTVCNVTEGEALGHTWADATCTAAKTCTVCNATEGEALGHTWADATCTAAKTCTVCNVTEGEALGHSFGEWVTVKEPTFAEEGQAERVCACGEKETKTLEKLPYLLGDANLDGTITAADARIILRISAQLDTLEQHKLTLEVVDVTFDGVITAADARIVLRVSAKLQDMPVKK